MRIIKFSSLNLHHVITYEINPITPFTIDNAYIGAGNTINICTDKGIHIIIHSKRTGAFMYTADRTKKKEKHGFNDVLTSLLKGREVNRVTQHCMDRIAVLETSGNVKAFVQFIPGRFNFIICDRHNAIINQYSHIKNRHGDVEYGIGDIFKLPKCREEKTSYLMPSELSLIAKGISIDEMMKQNVQYASLENNAYSVTPFSPEESAFSGSSVSAVIWDIMEYERTNDNANMINEALTRMEREQNKLRKQIQNLSDNDKIVEQIERFREYGETLKMHLHSMKKDQYLEIPSVYDNDKILHIELNPALSPVENMKHFFSEAERKERQIESNKKRQKDLQKQLNMLEMKIKALENGDTSNLDKKSKKKQQKKRIGRRFTSPSGFNIIAGRNARENDYITVNIASKNDVFFHAREKHGSHVIMQTQGRPYKRIDLEYAASIAAYFSDGRHAALVPVQYTEARYVVKRRNSPPGTVHMTREEVIMVKPLDY